MAGERKQHTQLWSNGCRTNNSLEPRRRRPFEIIHPSVLHFATFLKDLGLGMDNQFWELRLQCFRDNSLAHPTAHCPCRHFGLLEAAVSEAHATRPEVDPKEPF